MASTQASVAQTISEEAESVGAGRICYRVGEKFIFSKPDPESVRAVLETDSPEKYKLQSRVGTRWADASKYSMLGAPGVAIDHLRAGDAQAILSTSPDVFKAGSDREPRHFLIALRGFNRAIAERLGRNYSRTISTPARDALWHIDAGVGSLHTQYLAASLDTIDVLTSHPIDGLLAGGETEIAIAAIEARTRKLPEVYASKAARASVAVNRGKVLSTTSRTDAAAEFAQARELDDGEIIKDLYTDMGAWTYFDTPDIGPGAEALAESIKSDIGAADPAPAANRLAVAISVDPSYLRIYAPVLFHYAQQMPDVDHNIILCGDRESTQNAISDVEAFRSALAQVNRSGQPGNIRFYQIPVPAQVIEPRSFYASARFFAIEALLHAYPSVYIMDVDLATAEDPRPYYKRAARVPFATPLNKGFEALSPWRRYMAGNLAVNRSVLGTPILDDLQLYLAHGLTHPNSWMLDQNAFAYAIERNGDAFSSLNGLHRPFTQPRFRAVWESNFPR